MGNSSFSKVEVALSSSDDATLRKGCYTLIKILQSPPRGTPWEWIMHLIGDVIQKNAHNATTVAYSEEFHKALQSFTLLPRQIVAGSDFQAVLHHNLVCGLNHPISFVSCLQDL